MKKILLLLTLVTLTFGTSYGHTTYGNASIEKTPLTLENMLTKAIQDEYMARSEYDLMMEKFDVSRPFSNITGAEEMHINALEDLFETYDLTIPKDESQIYVLEPESLQDNYEMGISAEIANIEMYEHFLSQSLPSDVRIVFEHLKRGSENHLKAFQRHFDKMR